MNFRKKLLLMMIGLSLIPLLILGLVSILSLNGIEATTSSLVHEIGNKSVDASTTALNNLGEEIINQKSEDVAHQINIYLAAHPGKTLADLQKDPSFQALASQKVGETGYVAFFEKKTLMSRFHPNEQYLNYDFHQMKETLPEFYAIAEKIKTQDASSGYYDWLEADGSIRQKYLAISSTDQPTADGILLVVAATTYIDEFNAPAQEIEAYLTQENQNLIQTMQAAIASTIVLIIIIVVITVAVILAIGFIFSRSVTGPLTRAVEMIQEMVQGHLSMRLGLEQDDEIGILSREMDRFADNLQNEVIATMQKIANGEPVQYIPITDDADEIGPAMVKMVETINSLIEETNTLTTRATAGDLTVQGDISAFSGRYREIIGGFNETLNTLIAPLQEAIRLAGSYAGGIFTDRFDPSVPVSGDLIPFRDALNAIGIKSSGAMNEVKKQVEALVASMEETNASLEGVSAGSHELAVSSTKVSELSEKSSNNIQQVLQTMEDLSTTVTTIAQRTNDVSGMAGKTNEISENGASLAEMTEGKMQAVTESVRETSTVINEMANQMREIIKIVDIISDISDQTNLLALNAAIEAARAGEAGLGFAVVAGEVKSLAQESQKSAEHIAAIISTLQTKTDQIYETVKHSSEEAESGNKAVSETLTVFQNIARLVADIATNMEQIAAASEEEAASVEEITASVSEMGTFSRETEDIAVSVSSATEETSAALDQISKAVNEASQSIYLISAEMNKFRTTDQ